MGGYITLATYSCIYSQFRLCNQPVNQIDLATTLLGKAANTSRFFVAIAGPPASGKTTLSESLANALAKETSVSVVAMDGFHYDNNILEEFGLLDRKGSPNTFDVAGLHLLLSGLQNQSETIAAPVFDRERDLARSSAKLIYPEDHIILVEGNYLLCETEPWNALHSFFNTTISLDTPIQVIEERLIQRWLDHDHTLEQAKRRTQFNDLPNAEYVIKNSIAAQYTIYN